MATGRGFAVIGAGDRGSVYSRALNELGAGKLVCICDVDEQRARRLKENQGYAAWSSSYEQAIEREDVDVVVNCTPAFFHPEVTEFAAERGKHILSEKPMALDMAGARRMAAAVGRHGIKFTLSFQRRYMPLARELREILQAGALGRGLLFYFSWVDTIRPKLAMHDALRGNGGPLNDMLCHWVDLVRWTTGAEPARVFAAGFTYGTERPELGELPRLAPDAAAVTVQFNNGDVLQATLCWGLARGVKGVASQFVVGPRGCIREGSDRELVLSQAGAEEQEIASGQAQVRTASAEAALIADFLAAIDRNQTPPISLKDGLAAQATSHAALRSLSEGQAVGVHQDTYAL